MAKENLKLLATVRAQGLPALGEERCDVAQAFVSGAVRSVCAAAVPHKILLHQGPQTCSEGCEQRLRELRLSLVE